VYLIATDAYDRMMAEYGQGDCSAEGQVLIGHITWSGDSGTLTFAVPNVAPGQHYLEVEVRNTSPSCWRVAQIGPILSGKGLLLFTVGDQPAASLPPMVVPTDVPTIAPAPPSGLSQASQSVPNRVSLQLIVIGVLGTAAACLAVAGLRRVRRRP
jgi:hypothetical protein